MSGRRAATGALAALALLASAPDARAWDAEWQAGPEAGGGFVLDDQGVVGEAIAWLALQANVQLLRSISSDLGLGFALRVGTRDFGDLVVLGGVEGLFPVIDAFPIVLSAGAGLDCLTGEGLWYARLWWGARSHNQLSPYATAFGLFVEYQRAIDGTDAPVLLFGATVDGYALLWPFMWLYELLAVDQGPAVV
ncbi:MAG: hypothetical protein JXB32_02190 [Deltaproteobacteria bacterium]|nr:hypothetical protein [Deltaproteobacteria bacterium]